MSKFSELLSDLQQPRTVTPRERAHAAAASVQTSLFGRLRKSRGSAVAGRVGWMLVRLGQEGHPEFTEACAAIQGLGAADLALFLALARVVAAKLSGEGGVLAGRIVGVLEGESGRRGEGKGAA